MLHLYHLLLPLLLFGAAATTISASFCGKSGVPYSLEILPNGAPVLGCAQPTCVISAVDGDGEFQEDSQFLTDATGQSDGFFRDGDRALKRFRHQATPKLIANCSGQFNELSCPRRNQWVGGIEYIDHPRQPLILQCCSFEGLRFSQEVGSTTIGPGEAITGGEVVRAGRQISFDVIANVRKVVKSENSPNRVTYEVTVRRMNCLPDPPEPEVEFDSDVPAEVAKILANAKNKEVTDKFKQQPQAGKKARADKQQKYNAAKQLAAATQNLPEISGGEGDRSPAAIPQQPQQPSQQQQSRNNEAVIQPGLRQQQQQNLARPQPQLQQGQGQQGGGGGGGGGQQQQQQQQFIPQQQQQQQLSQFANQQLPEAQQGQQQQQFQGQFQQQQQQQFQPAQQQQSGFLSGGASGSDQLVAVTPHPLFGMMSFPTLPPHTFPTLPPHSFPTLPPHTFPTFAPHLHHTFPTLPPHTLPSFAPHAFHTLPGLFGTTVAPALGGRGGGALSPAGGGGGAMAFAAPSFSAPVGAGPIPAGFSGPGQQQQQQILTPHSPFRRDHNGLPTMHQPPARVAPASGTILAAMQGDRHPIMHPILGLIGYSNGPPPGQQPGK